MQKKIMTLWQMIILVVLLAAVTISMFFPVLNPTGKKMVRYMESFMEKYQDDEEPSSVGELSPTSQADMISIRRTGDCYEL